MARPLRIERAGGWYHLTARGNERRPIFRDDRDRRHLCGLVGEVTDRFDVRVLAYVLMDNHYHLLVETPKANLSRAMHWLQLSYSAWFNRRHDRVGHLFQGRFSARLVEPEAWGAAVSRYVHLNPVRVGVLGLGKSARAAQRLGVDAAPQAEEVQERLRRLRRYRWSSYRAYVGLEAGPAWLDRRAVLERMGGAPEARQWARYREYVEEAVREGLPASPWESLTAQVALGGAEFIASLQGALRGDVREQPSLRGLSPRLRWDQVVAAMERVKGEQWNDFRDRRGDEGRDLALYVARRRCGLTLKELGQAVGGLDYRSVGWAVQRIERRLAGEVRLRRTLQQLESRIKNPET